MILGAFTPHRPSRSACRSSFYLAATPIHAGFPSPAEDLAAKRIDIKEILVTPPQATFLVRVSGTSIEGRGAFMWDVWEVTDEEDGEAEGKCVGVQNTEGECLAWIAEQAPRLH